MACRHGATACVGMCVTRTRVTVVPRGSIQSKGSWDRNCSAQVHVSTATSQTRGLGQPLYDPHLIACKPRLIPTRLTAARSAGRSKCGQGCRHRGIRRHGRRPIVPRNRAQVPRKHQMPAWACPMTPDSTRRSPLAVAKAKEHHRRTTNARWGGLRSRSHGRPC
eukprot:4766494-Prymnesium_polylepis.1